MIENRKKKIAVLDDDQVQHILFKKRVQKVGSEVELQIFEEGEDLLEHLKNYHADVVISDLNMESMSGWTFIEELFKLNFEGKLFIVSASINREDRLKAKKDKRIHGFFEKPLSDSDLLQILTA
jgi:CheY-like chemotaxis protein